jgi:hypothetical protein
MKSVFLRDELFITIPALYGMTVMGVFGVLDKLILTSKFFLAIVTLVLLTMQQTYAHILYIT